MDKYLLYILHEVNTIIIPGLGALTVTNKAKGEIMFMSYLKHDDGNLAKHIAEKENIAENDAKNLIAKYVREIHAQLDKGETYDMYQFGRFIKKDGEIDFESWNSYQHNPEDVYAENTSNTLVSEEILISNEEPTIETPEEIIAEKAKEETTNDSNESKPTESPVEKTEEISDANEVIEELLSASKPIEVAKSIDDILKTEESETEKIAPVVAETKTSEESLKPEIDTSQIKPSENVFIPKEELAEIAETQQKEKLQAQTKPKNTVTNRPERPKPKTVSKKNKEPNQKRKTILLILLIFVVLAGSSVAIFYDKIEAALSTSKENTTKQHKSTEDNDKNLEEIEKQVALEQESSKAQTETVADTKTEINKETEKITEPVKNTNGNLPYHIIGGSFGVEENANRLAKKYTDAGKNASVLGKFDDMYLVSCESFATREEANAALKSGEVKGWIFKYPK